MMTALLVYLILGALIAFSIPYIKFRKSIKNKRMRIKIFRDKLTIKRYNRAQAFITAEERQYRNDLWKVI